MLSRPATLLTTVVFTGLLVLSSCGGSDTAKDGPSTSPTASTDWDKLREKAGIPKNPVGDKRATYLAGLKDIDPWLVRDEEDAVDNGVNQCSSLGGDKAVWAAQQRFGSGTRSVTEAEAKQIIGLVREHICPDA
ncbi:hypothetical protein H9Y04_44105 [Streptomyces sp. TRM66268-LWL]|uniref:DUF732 domain-containing protein n=1 Tax=Streptomyces polyasparticus TaxID=2767826 RepID=A0ABR7SVJ2_9ACTN|nr:hypothetical protein [Streptomyces polyasparticus]MBC9719506.1 hypothetical protein [Streptomyces polyasparticus]